MSYFVQMGYEEKNYPGDVEILKRPPFEGIAITLQNTCFNSDGVAKAGSPISKMGLVANDENAIGILLHDVYLERPQGTIIKKGYINTAVAQEHSGVTIADAVKTALPMIVFE